MFAKKQAKNRKKKDHHLNRPKKDKVAVVDTEAKTNNKKPLIREAFYLVIHSQSYYF